MNDQTACTEEITKGWETLSRVYPYPQDKPAQPEVSFPLDGFGREIIFDLINERSLKNMVEVGSFFGDSAMKFLTVTSVEKLLAIDFWEGNPTWINDFAKEFNVTFPEPRYFNSETKLGEANHHSVYRQFLVNTWEFRDRIIPIRENYRIGSDPGPDSKRENADDWIFDRILASGFRPDVFYWDADKDSLREMRRCHEIWPEAEMTGDDWEWLLDGGHPIRKSVCGFCEELNFSVFVNRCNWVLRKNGKGEVPTVIYVTAGMDMEPDITLPIEYRYQKRRRHFWPIRRSQSRE